MTLTRSTKVNEEFFLKGSSITYFGILPRQTLNIIGSFPWKNSVTVWQVMQKPMNINKKSLSKKNGH
jgi:hypothetical protein